MATEPSEITLTLPRCSIEEPGDAIRTGREHLPPGRSRIQWIFSWGSFKVYPHIYIYICVCVYTYVGMVWYVIYCNLM